jgi:hypothetical protein
MRAEAKKDFRSRHRAGALGNLHIRPSEATSKKEIDMGNRDLDFASFVQTWGDENLGSFGDYTDPSDLQHFHRSRAERLRLAAEAAGFSSEVERISRSTGGLPGYVERLYEQAEFRRRYGDI